MDIETMQTEAILTEFIDFFEKSWKAMNDQAPEADKVPEDSLAQMVAVLQMGKIMFLSKKMLELVMKQVDPNGELGSA